MQEWWNSLTQDNKIALMIPFIVAFLASLGFLINKLFDKETHQSITISQKNDSGKNFVFINPGTVNIGLTLEQFEERLKRREAEVTVELNQAHNKDRQLLQTQLQEIQQQLLDVKISHEAYIASLME